MRPPRGVNVGWKKKAGCGAGAGAGAGAGVGVGGCCSYTSKEMAELLRSASRLSVLASTGGEEHRNFFTS